jgi:hypothetical protein
VRRLQFNHPTALRHIRGNRSSPSAYVANNSRRELNGIFVRQDAIINGDDGYSVALRRRPRTVR